MEKKGFGNFGEGVAAAYLRAEGYRILERNYRSPEGEIDVIAEKGEALIFVEVKARRSLCFGFPAEAVDEKKRKRLRSCALHYLGQSGREWERFSFQIVEVYIHQIENAF